MSVEIQGLAYSLPGRTTHCVTHWKFETNQRGKRVRILRDDLCTNGARCGAVALPSCPSRGMSRPPPFRASIRPALPSRRPWPSSNRSRAINADRQSTAIKTPPIGRSPAKDESRPHRCPVTAKFALAANQEIIGSRNHGVGRSWHYLERMCPETGHLQYKGHDTQPECSAAKYGGTLAYSADSWNSPRCIQVTCPLISEWFSRDRDFSQCHENQTPSNASRGGTRNACSGQ